jgi:hypothetical protein
MSRDLRFAFLVLILLILSVGCSHSPFFLTGGTKVSAGIPEYGELAYLNGIGIADVSRESTEVEIEIDEKVGLTIDKETNAVKGIKKITRRIGRQITGYLVDLAKVCPEAAVAWCKGGDARQGE